jgi:U3 small nucleolar RNA-associated protein 4
MGGSTRSTDKHNATSKTRSKSSKVTLSKTTKGTATDTDAIVAVPVASSIIPVAQRIPFAVHRCRFVEWVPSGISHISYNIAGTHLAAVHENGDISIWSVADGWVLDRVIPGTGMRSVQQVFWLPPDRASLLQASGASDAKAMDRLFSVGLNGCIVEWDLTKLTPRRTAESHGGAIWCVAVSNNGRANSQHNAVCEVAIGCEDGCVRIFEISAEMISVRTVFSKHQSRCVSVCWSHDDSKIVSGGGDSTIRVWDVSSQQSIQRIQVERSPSKKATVVWAVVILPDGTIVSGDSSGRTRFWDAQFGSLIQTSQPHSADVLTLAVSADHKHVYASGIDSQVVQFSYTDVDASLNHWVVAGTHRAHTHDVTCLALHENASLVSGSVDTQLTSYSTKNFARSSPNRISTLPYHSPVSLSCSRQLMSVHMNKTIHIWKLGGSSSIESLDSDAKDREKLSVDSPYTHVLQMTLASMLNLSCSQLSPDARWLVCSSPLEIKLFCLEWSDDSLSVAVEKKLEIAGSISPANVAAFSPDSSHLALGCYDHTVRIFETSTWQCVAKFTDHISVDEDYGPSDDSDSDSDSDSKTTTSASARSSKCAPDTVRSTVSGLITQVAWSADGSFIASADDQRRVHIYNINTQHYTATLPVPAVSITSMVFQPQTNHLIVALANNRLMDFDVETRSLGTWTEQATLRQSCQSLSPRGKFIHLSFVPHDATTLLIQSHAYMCHVQLPPNPTENSDSEWSLSSTNSRKRKVIHVAETSNKSRRRENQGSATQVFFRVVTRFQPLLFAEFLGARHIVVVERPWLHIMQSLPKTLHRKRFRT